MTPVALPTPDPNRIADRDSPVRHVGHSEGIRELRRRIARFERIYEMSSESMLRAVQRGERKDTSEIAQWLTWYQLLKRLEA